MRRTAGIKGLFRLSQPDLQLHIEGQQEAAAQPSLVLCKLSDADIPVNVERFQGAVFAQVERVMRVSRFGALPGAKPPRSPPLPQLDHIAHAVGKIAALFNDGPPRSPNRRPLLRG